MNLRETNLARLGAEEFDVVVIGGGINGAVSAACLSARGAKVALIDRGDFAGFTSQHSSNLAWGGIKYMESYEFGLVRKLCASRNHLIRSYPSTVKEIRFLVAHEKQFRHGRLKLFLGAILYWCIGNLFTKAPKLHSREDLQATESVVNADLTDGGFEYSDAYLHDNDARFTWSFIRGALDHGAACVNYVESLGARRENGMWHLQFRDIESGKTIAARARVVVNACGPFVDEHNERSGQVTEHKHVFSKGIHLIVRRLSPATRVLTFFADDGRLFFVIPMGNRTCIGTTDTRVEDPNTGVTAEDRAFVLANINKRLRLAAPLTEADILSERCGVRPLASLREATASKDWMQMSRKHAVDVSHADAHLSIFGGKLTDCLNVGEEVASLVAQFGVELPHADRPWYGEPPAVVRDRFFHQSALMGLDALTSASSAEPLSQRLWRRYGYFAFAMLEAIRADATQAELVIEGAEYTRCEIEHAARHEMVTKLADFLRRRSKISMVMHSRTIAKAPGLLAAAKVFFGESAEAKLAEYFEHTGELSPPVPAPLAAVAEDSAA